MKIQYEVSIDDYYLQGYRYQDIEITPICRNCKNRISPTSELVYPSFCPSCGVELEYPNNLIDALIFNGKMEINCHEDGQGNGKMICEGISYPWRRKNNET